MTEAAVGNGVTLDAGEPPLFKSDGGGSAGGEIPHVAKIAAILFAVFLFLSFFTSSG